MQSCLNDEKSLAQPQRQKVEHPSSTSLKRHCSQPPSGVAQTGNAEPQHRAPGIAPAWTWLDFGLSPSSAATTQHILIIRVDQQQATGATTHHRKHCCRGPPLSLITSPSERSQNQPVDGTWDGMLLCPGWRQCCASHQHKPFFFRSIPCHHCHHCLLCWRSSCYSSLDGGVVLRNPPGTQIISVGPACAPPGTRQDGGRKSRIRASVGVFSQTSSQQTIIIIIANCNSSSSKRGPGPDILNPGPRPTQRAPSPSTPGHRHTVSPPRGGNGPRRHQRPRCASLCAKPLIAGHLPSLPPSPSLRLP